MAMTPAFCHGDRFEAHIDDEGGSLDVPALVAGVPAHAELYMCGPIRLMDAVRRAWADRGLDRTNLRDEIFGNSGCATCHRVERCGVPDVADDGRIDRVAECRDRTARRGRSSAVHECMLHPRADIGAARNHAVRRAPACHT